MTNTIVIYFASIVFAWLNDPSNCQTITVALSFSFNNRRSSHTFIKLYTESRARKSSELAFSYDGTWFISRHKTATKTEGKVEMLVIVIKVSARQRTEFKFREDASVFGFG